MKNLSLATAAVLAAGILTACGTQSGAQSGAADMKDDGRSSAAVNASDSSGAEPIDVCALVDSTELDRLFDDHFGAGESVHHEQTGGDQCLWDNGTTLPLKQFSVTIWREEARSENFAGGDVTAEKLWQAQKEYADAPQPVDLGDDAYLTGNALEVLDGTTIYSFTTVGGESAMAIGGMKQIATAVVNR